MKRLQRLLASIIGSLLGLFAGTALFILSVWHPWEPFAVSWRQLLEGMTLQWIVIALLSFVGWICFLLPIAMRYKENSTSRKIRHTIMLGTLFGAMLVTVTFTWLFHGAPRAAFMSIPYELSGMVNAGIATTVCLLLLRRQQSDQ